MILGCGPAGQTAGSAEPPPVSSLDQAETVDSGRMEIRLLGEQAGSEEFELRRRHDTLTMTARGYAILKSKVEFRAEVVQSLDWSLQRASVEVKMFDDSCSYDLQVHRGLVQVQRHHDRDTEDLAAEPVEHARYYYGMQPASQQLLTCALASDHDVAITYYPGFTSVLGPRQPIQLTSAPGEQLTRVRIDNLIDVICDGDRFLVLHYPQHALTIARDGFQPLAAELSAADPTNDPWFGLLSCN